MNNFIYHNPTELFLRRLQKVLSIVSLATVVLLLLQVTTGIAGPEWFRLYLFPVLLSAAVGYLTNYIAIEMLFKPYERREFHWIRPTQSGPYIPPVLGDGNIYGLNG